MSTARWLRSLVTANPDLYRAIYDWNVYPHRWALPAWLDDSAAPVVSLLEKTPRGRQRLGAHYRRTLGLEEMVWDFQTPSRRLALLSAVTLARLAHFAGAALHWPRLARVVTKDDRRAVTDAIGDDAYAFAMRRGRQLAGPDGLDALGLPENSLSADISQTGWQTLLTCLGPEPAALHQRFRLKTPRDLALSTGVSTEESSARAWTFLQPITQEIFSPEERRCFA